jgi:hypothetical protein
LQSYFRLRVYVFLGEKMNQKMEILNEAENTLWELYKTVKERTMKIEVALVEINNLQDEIKQVIYDTFRKAEIRTDEEDKALNKIAKEIGC